MVFSYHKSTYLGLTFRAPFKIWLGCDILDPGRQRGSVLAQSLDGKSLASCSNIRQLGANWIKVENEIWLN